MATNAFPFRPDGGGGWSALLARDHLGVLASDGALALESVGGGGGAKVPTSDTHITHPAR
jgi:hypothetical protein